MKFGVVRYGEFEWVVEDGACRHVLPVCASIESLGVIADISVDGAVVRYGDRVLVAVDRRNGVAAAVYEFVDDDHGVDSRLNLIWLGNEIHEDAGHALEACMNWCRHN